MAQKLRNSNRIISQSTLKSCYKDCLHENFDHSSCREIFRTKRCERSAVKSAVCQLYYTKWRRTASYSYGVIYRLIVQAIRKLGECKSSFNLLLVSAFTPLFNWRSWPKFIVYYVTLRSCARQLVCLNFFDLSVVYMWRHWLNNK